VLIHHAQSAKFDFFCVFLLSGMANVAEQFLQLDRCQRQQCIIAKIGRRSKAVDLLHGNTELTGDLWIGQLVALRGNGVDCKNRNENKR
jgi:hypothetical protein